MKLTSETHPFLVEERLSLPSKPSSEAVRDFRRQLQKWMRKYKRFATIRHNEIVASLGEPSVAPSPDSAEWQQIESARDELQAIARRCFGDCSPSFSPSASLPYPHQANSRTFANSRSTSDSLSLQRDPTHSFSHYLNVSESSGAGVELRPEGGGMRVVKIYSVPGQP